MASCVECYRRKQKASFDCISIVWSSTSTSLLITSSRVGSVIASGPETIALTERLAIFVSSTSRKRLPAPAGEPRWLGKLPRLRPRRKFSRKKIGKNSVKILTCCWSSDCASTKNNGDTSSPQEIRDPDIPASTSGPDERPQSNQTVDEKFMDDLGYVNNNADNLLAYLKTV